MIRDRIRADVFYCRSCGKTESGPWIPNQWYGLKKFRETPELRPTGMGIFCSIRCLIAAVPALQERERSAGTPAGTHEEAHARPA